jgi:hypothetical protein
MINKAIRTRERLSKLDTGILLDTVKNADSVKHNLESEELLKIV